MSQQECGKCFHVLPVQGSLWVFRFLSAVQTTNTLAYLDAQNDLKMIRSGVMDDKRFLKLDIMIPLCSGLDKMVCNLEAQISCLVIHTRGSCIPRWR